MNKVAQDENMKMCNCRKPSECPLEGRCLEQCLIYKATVSSNSSSKYYIGSTGQSFKSRYTAHKSSFKKQQQSSETSLSKHIWHLSEKQTPYTIKWEVMKKCIQYKCGTRKCDLCLTEKLYILNSDPRLCLNQNSELLQKCRHMNKYKLAKLNTTLQDLPTPFKHQTTLLTDVEKSFIEHEQELDDNIVTKAMKIITEQYPKLATQPTSLSSIPEELNCSTQPTIFIHHIAAQHHFIMSTSISNKITTFDSLNLDTAHELTNQIQHLYAPEKTGRKVHHIHVKHQQHGSVDCGLFAVAYAIEAASGQDLEVIADIEFVQEKMREHLLKCFETKKMSRFPKMRKKKKT